MNCFVASQAPHGLFIFIFKTGEKRTNLHLSFIYIERFSYFDRFFYYDQLEDGCTDDVSNILCQFVCCRATSAKSGAFF